MSVASFLALRELHHLLNSFAQPYESQCSLLHDSVSEPSLGAISRKVKALMHLVRDRRGSDRDPNSKRHAPGGESFQCRETCASNAVTGASGCEITSTETSVCR